MEFLNLTDDAVAFIQEWENGKDYINAFTSGSTGTPKKIRLLKNDMVESAKATCKFFGIDSSSVMLCPLSASYIAGKMMIVRAIVSDSVLIFQEPSNSPFIPKEYEKVDFIPVVPSQIPGLLARDISSLGTLLVGGAPLSISQEELLVKQSFNSYVSYGMTETCSHVAIRRIGTTIYDALPGIEFTQDSRGCLKVIASKFSFGELVTNDIVELHSPTSFTWLGRIDNVVISGGIKLYPELIERKIQSVLGGIPFYIIGQPSEKWGQELHLYIEDESVSVQELNADLRRILLSIEMPKRIHKFSRLKRTSTGKIKRIALDL